MDELLKYLEKTSQDWHYENDDSSSPKIIINLSINLGIKQLDELIEAIKLHNLLNSVKQNRTLRVVNDTKIVPISEIK